MSEPMNTFGVNGYVDILLVDRATHRVVKHIRKRNHLTEPFARWLFAANLSGLDSETRSFITTRTDYKDTQFFKGLITCNPISYTLGAFPRYGRQCQTVGSKGSFKMFLLNDKVNVNAATEIAPHLDADLTSYNTGLIVYYGTYNDNVGGVYNMKFEDAATKWSNVGDNPAFTCSYMKDDEEQVRIKSVILAGDHSDGHVWVERSSPIIASNVSEATWNRRREITSSDSNQKASMETPPADIIKDSSGKVSRFNQNTWDAYYVLVPFMRNTNRDGSESVTDGLYAIDQTKFSTTTLSDSYSGSVDADNIVTSETNIPRTNTAVKYLTYYDFGSRETFTGTSDAKVKTEIGPKGYFYPSAVTLKYLTGGFVLGVDSNSNTVLFKVCAISSSSVVQAYIVNSWPKNATKYDDPRNGGAETTIRSQTLCTVNKTVGATSLTGCAPVMVARRGTKEVEDSETHTTVTVPNDTIEIFFTPEYGTYDGKSGYALHKLIFNVTDYMNGATVQSACTYLGRVAVLDFAIGQAVLGTSDVFTEVAHGNTKNTYCIGAYEDGIYYLPITHLKKGCKPCNWVFDSTVADANSSVACWDANGDYQPGIMLADKEYIRVGDYVLGHTGERRSLVTTNEGRVNLVLNRTRHWQNIQSGVLSGVDLDGEGIEKKKNQILVVKYTYTMEVYPEAPNEVTNATATTNQSGQIELHWTPSDASFIKLSAKEGAASTDGEYKTLVVLSGTKTSYVDTGLSSGQTKTYKIQSCREACKSPSEGITVEGSSL